MRLLSVSFLSRENLPLEALHLSAHSREPERSTDFQHFFQ